MAEENSFDLQINRRERCDVFSVAGALLRRIAEKIIAFDITSTKASSDSKQSDDAEWKIVKECDKRSDRMEKYYLEKAIEYAKYTATNIDVDSMVEKFKNDFIGEFDTATLNKIADTYGKYYRQGIEDTLKAIRGTRKDDSK